MSIADVIDEWKKRDQKIKERETMERELYFLLSLIMWDIRVDWYRPWYNPWRGVWRKKWAMQLAEGLNELTVLGRLYALKRTDDGRSLRADLKDGGYEGMQDKHGFKENEDGRYNIAEIPNHIIEQVARLYHWEDAFYNFEHVNAELEKLISIRNKK